MERTDSMTARDTIDRDGWKELSVSLSLHANIEVADSKDT